MAEPHSLPTKFLMLPQNKPVSEELAYRNSAIICSELLGDAFLEFLGKQGITKTCRIEVYKLCQNCFGIKVI